jgi:hypothetical protein
MCHKFLPLPPPHPQSQRSQQSQRRQNRQDIFHHLDKKRNSLVMFPRPMMAVANLVVVVFMLSSNADPSFALPHTSISQGVGQRQRQQQQQRRRPCLMLQPPLSIGESINDCIVDDTIVVAATTTTTTTTTTTSSASSHDDDANDDSPMPMHRRFLIEQRQQRTEKTR